MMKYFILTLVLAAVAHAKTFNVTEQNTTCLLLSLDGTVDLTLHEKTSKPVSLSFESAELLESNCTVIKLNLTQSVEVWFQFVEAPEPGLWSVEPVTWFSPRAVFPEVNQTGEVEYQTTPLGHFRKNVSYTCNSKSELSFNGSTPGFNISVTATIANFEIQSLKGKEFVPGEKCDKDMTTAAPATTAVPVTTPKPNTTQDFTCESGNITRFRLTGSFSLSITYNTTSHKQATVPIDLYKATDVTTLCSSNTSETLTFRFFKGWSIEYVFERETETVQKYHISNITVTFVHDDHLPNTTSFNVTETVRYASNNYLEASTNGYYYCKSKILLKINEVEITTTNFKYKAFNDGTKGIDFNSGEVTECSADEETSSVVPIAVGAALAGLVVIVLIAYLIGRRRSRKAGYESV